MSIVSPPAVASLIEVYSPIATEMEQVGQELDASFVAPNRFLQAFLSHSQKLGGKRLRPALLLLMEKLVRIAHGTEATPAEEKDVICLATAIEMIHTATLIHDDVLDEAEIRRQEDTVNARWNNETSILLGDYLFARALRGAARVEDLRITQIFAAATEAVCQGELTQVASRGNFSLTEQDYLAIVSGKTAALLVASCRIGALCGGGDDAMQQRLGDFGEKIGVAFQIVDDLLDITGDEARVGKSLGSDFSKGKLTLPIIHFLQNSEAQPKAKMLELLQREEPVQREELLQLLEATKSIDFARSEAKRFTDEALELLTNFAETPVRNSLAQLATFVTARKY